MRHILTAAAAIAVSALLASTAVRAQTNYQPGGPAKVGNQCIVITDEDQGFGYYAACPPGSKSVVRNVKKRAKKSE